MWSATVIWRAFIVSWHVAHVRLIHCRYTDRRQKLSSSERRTFSATPRIHLLSFYFDSMSCSCLVKKMTGYGLHSQGLVLSRSREFSSLPTDGLSLESIMDLNLVPRSNVHRVLRPWSVYAFTAWHFDNFYVYSDVTGLTIPSWGGGI
jgi:hypothetical protein